MFGYTALDGFATAVILAPAAALSAWFQLKTWCADRAYDADPTFEDDAAWLRHELDRVGYFDEPAGYCPCCDDPDLCDDPEWAPSAGCLYSTTTTVYVVTPGMSPEGSEADNWPLCWDSDCVAAGIVHAHPPVPRV